MDQVFNKIYKVSVDRRKAVNFFLYFLKLSSSIEVKSLYDRKYQEDYFGSVLEDGWKQKC